MVLQISDPYSGQACWPGVPLRHRTFISSADVFGSVGGVSAAPGRPGRLIFDGRRQDSANWSLMYHIRFILYLIAS